MESKLTKLFAEQENRKEIEKLILDHQIPESLLLEHYHLLEAYFESLNLCKKRERLDKCLQPIRGYRYQLHYNKNQTLNLVLTDCLHRINNIDRKTFIDNFLIRHYDDELLSLSLTKDFVIKTRERKEIADFLKDNLRLKSYKGLYLHGESGSGKTFIFILLANKMIQKKQTICFVSWPEFVSEVKKSFNNQNDSLKQLDQLKSCDFLFIDDLGGESISPWERDELLFPVLNARVLPLKTTFINSNFNLQELQQCYSLQKSKVEEIKVRRLMERIKRLVLPMKLGKQPFNEN